MKSPLALLMLLPLGACSSAPLAGHDAVGHVVVLAGGDSELLIAIERDLEDLLQQTPGVLEAHVGPRADVAARAGVTDVDYDVLLWVIFEDEAALQAYLVSPAHVALVERTLPHLTRLTVFDAWIGRAVGE